MGWENKEGQLQILRKQSYIFFINLTIINTVWKLRTKVNSQKKLAIIIEFRGTHKRQKKKLCEAKDFEGLIGEFYCLSPFSTHLKK